MKRTLPFLLLLILVSCSQTPPSYPPVEPAANAARSVPPMAPQPAPARMAQREEQPTNAGQSIAVPVTPYNVETNAPSPPPVGRTTPEQPLPAPGAVPSGVPTMPENPTPATVAAPEVNAANPVNTTNEAPHEAQIPAGMVDFQNTPIDQVLQVYAEYVNRTLLRPANLPAPQITLKNQTPLSRKEMVQALDAVLGLNGIAMIDVGEKFVKAVPVAQANQEAAPLATNNPATMPELGQYVTHVVQLKYVKPSDMVSVLTPFAKAPNGILPIDASQILVLRDYTENVKRMLEMIKEIDVSVPPEIVSEVIPLKYAKASDIADALNSLSSGGGTTSVGHRSSGPTGGAAGGFSSGFNNRMGMGSNFAPGSTRYGMQANTTPAGTPSSGNSFTDRLRNIIQKASTSGSLEILGETKIIADERTNSLMIFATRHDMDMIKNVVAKLDVVLAQVLIETAILDVQLNNGWNFGLTGAQVPTENNPRGGAINNGQSFFDSFLGNVSSNASSFLAAAPPGFSYWAQIGKSFNVALQAAANDERINVVQRPQILTSHATPGSIFVGNTVPYVTSTYYGGGYAGGPSSSYQQLQVGIGLTVTPYINPDGLVVMQIDESIDELSGSTEITGVGAVPNTTSRKLSAEVAVRDGDSIMLGGFIRNSSDSKHSGVPILKDIPLLGSLFSNQSKTKERKELLVLMRPTVLRTPAIAAAATAREKSQLPGVRGAEAEVRREEKKQLEDEQKAAEYDRKMSGEPVYQEPPPANQPSYLEQPDYIPVPDTNSMGAFH